MKSKVLVALVCASFLLINACSDKTYAPHPEYDLSDEIEPLSEQLVVRIFIDATGSMKGYVAPGYSTNYAQIFTCLEGAALGGWSNVKVEFHKFGTKVKPLEGRQYLKAAETGFYEDRDINQETNIQEAIEHKAKTGGSTGELRIIVTDLFQSESDVVLLVKKLKDEYIKRNLAIGILGIRSQFRGTIYDVRGGSFQYSSKENPESHRPFYMLMLGKHSDIVRYFERLKSSGLSFISESNFAVFSRHLVDPLSSFHNASLESTENLQECIGLVASGSQTELLKQFRIPGSPENAAFTVKAKYHPLLYTVPFNLQELKSEVIAKKCQNSVLVDDTKAEKAFTIEETEFADGELRFTARISPPSLAVGNIFFYDVTLRPEESSYQLPIWFSRWDMGVIQDGSKTLNLNRFVTDLWQTTVQVHKPKIARFCCYFKTR